MLMVFYLNVFYLPTLKDYYKLCNEAIWFTQMMCYNVYAPINVKPAGQGRRGIGQDFDLSLWPGGRACEFSCCSGGRDI